MLTLAVGDVRWDVISNERDNSGARRPTGVVHDVVRLNSALQIL